MLLTILLVIVVVILVGGLPTWERGPSRRHELGWFPSGLALLALIVLLILLSTGRMSWAQTKTEEVKAFVVDLKPLFDTVVWPALAAVAMAVVGVIVERIRKRFGVDLDRKIIETAVQSGLQLAQAKVGSSSMTNVRVQSQIVEQAASYAMTHVPAALKSLGIDVTTEAGRASLIEKIEARLAPAVMVAEASPGPMTVAAAATIANPDVSTVPAPVADVALVPVAVVPARGGGG